MPKTTKSLQPAADYHRWLASKDDNTLSVELLLHRVEQYQSGLVSAYELVLFCNMLPSAVE